LKIIFATAFFCLLFSLVSAAEREDVCQELFDKYTETYRKENYAEALIYLSEAYHMAQEENLIELKAKILNGYGMVYLKLSDHHKAIKYFLDAYKLVKDSKFTRTEITVLNNIARLYFLDKKIEKSTEFLNQAFQLAYTVKDTVLIGRIGINAGIICNESGEYEQAAQYLQKAIGILTNVGNLQTSLQKAQLEYLHNLCLRNESVQAESYALEMLSKYKADPSFSLKGLCYTYLCEAQKQQKQYHQALDHVQAALLLHNDISTQIKIFKQLVDIYKKLNKLNKVIQYQDSLLVYKDTQLHKSNADKILSIEARLGLHELEDELHSQQAKRSAERIIYTLSIVIALISIWMLRLQLKKHKQRKALEFEKEKNIQLQLKHQLHEKEMEEARLNNEIMCKNKELSSQILLQSHKNELIEEVIDKLSNLPNAKQSKQIEKIIHQLRQQTKENTDWKGFLTYFEQIQPKLLAILKDKYQNLSISELRLISYISSDMDTKEIARLFNITHEYCRKKKQRLAKKLGITTKEIPTFLNQLVKLSENEGNRS
jgi:tetratricopeptide (TPR) repeat protein